MNTTDTIIAPATAPGEGGIAIVRISGADSLSALKHYFIPSSKSAEFNTHQLYHGSLVDQKGQVVDEVMAVFMAAPNTYTRDDVVEIQCHGSQQVVKSILNLYQSYGLRLAEPGEFTYRAFMSGRLDLAQSEAVAELIHSKTDSSRRLALAQVDGALSRELYSFSKVLKHLLVLIEAWIDFPDEDLPAEDYAKIKHDVLHVRSDILTITGSYQFGRVMSEGASILLVGQPNVGKSSLLNALLGEDRAIVTSVSGTTRDLLEEGLTIGGIPVRLVDTAGLRETDDVVESEGIRRAENKLSVADLILLVVDGSRALDGLDYYVHKRCEGLPTFLIVTKDDIEHESKVSLFEGFPTFRVSSKTGFGLNDLRKGVSTFLAGDFLASSESVMLTQRRHYDALLSSLTSLDRVADSLSNNAPLELLALDLREALYHLGQISGETTTEDLLDDIFSGFCIGK